MVRAVALSLAEAAGSLAMILLGVAVARHLTGPRRPRRRSPEPAASGPDKPAPAGHTHVKRRKGTVNDAEVWHCTVPGCTWLEVDGREATPAP